MEEVALRVGPRGLRVGLRRNGTLLFLYVGPRAGAMGGGSVGSLRWRERHFACDERTPVYDAVAARWRDRGAEPSEQRQRVELEGHGPPSENGLPQLAAHELAVEDAQALRRERRTQHVTDEPLACAFVVRTDGMPRDSVAPDVGADGR